MSLFPSYPLFTSFFKSSFFCVLYLHHSLFFPFWRARLQCNSRSTSPGMTTFYNRLGRSEGRARANWMLTHSQKNARHRIDTERQLDQLLHFFRGFPRCFLRLTSRDPCGLASCCSPVAVQEGGFCPCCIFSQYPPDCQRKYLGKMKTCRAYF